MTFLDIVANSGNTAVRSNGRGGVVRVMGSPLACPGPVIEARGTDSPVSMHVRRERWGRNVYRARSRQEALVDADS
ncbi:hypothetical protein GCM10009540_03350 [Streptomyces turgidiscabies]